MKTAGNPPPASPVTLLDRYRDAGLADRLVSELDRRLRKRKRRRAAALRSTAAALIFLLVSLWTVTWVRDTATVSVPAATQTTLTLADGSLAQLNAHTELSTDFRFGRRVVHLDRGEGFFSIVPDSAHPFLVVTPHGTVRVTGTHFDVRLDPSGRAEVTLVEGHVTLQPSASAPVKLTPGEQATLSDAPPIVRDLSASDLERTLAWRQGKIVLDGLTLADAAARFADYHGCTLTVDPAVARVRLGGTYSLRNLPLFLDALKATGAVSVFPTGDGSYRIHRR
jgi:transmembrane sensor